MAKIVRFIETVVENFAGLRSKTVRYGNVTALSGKNGQGKTSIGTAPIWVLWGKDLIGADYTKDKYSPRPSNYEYDRVFASILLSIDGIEYKFAREIDKKGNNFYINDVDKTAGQFKEAVESLLDQDEFMALYFPAYFFNLHKDKQRELLVKAVPAPLRKTVLTEMSRADVKQKASEIILNPMSNMLEELLTKKTIDDWKGIHSGAKNKSGLNAKLKNELIAAESRTKTLKEQLERLPVIEIDVEAKQAEYADIESQIKEIEKVTDEAGDTNHYYDSLNARIQALQAQVSASAKEWTPLKEEEIADECKTCKQSLPEEAVKAVTADKERRMETHKYKHTVVVNKRKEAEAELATLKRIDVAEQLQKVRELDQQIEPIKEAIRNYKERARLSAEVEKAKEDEKATLASLRESTLILDAIKAFKAKEAELQAAEIESKFTTLKIRLFKFVKSSGEYEPDFSVQKDGKDYISLSVGEKIEAGLELTEVLFKQSDLITPVFIDGIGEYTGKVAAYDQVITGRAVYDQELQIEVDGVIV